MSKNNNICPACLGTGRIPDHEKVGREAVELRVEAGRNQEWVAQRMEISVSYLSALENGKKKWTLELWKKLVAATKQ